VTATSSPPRPSPPASVPRSPRRLLGPVLALPGIVWLFLFFVAPLYVVLSVVFGGVDPVFRTVIPVWNPILWSSDQPIYVLTHIVGKNGIFGPALLRTAVYVLTASVLCLLIAFPIAYLLVRTRWRFKGFLIDLRFGIDLVGLHRDRCLRRRLSVRRRGRRLVRAAARGDHEERHEGTRGSVHGRRP